MFEDLRDCLNGCQELKHWSLVGPSTSFLLSFGDSLPSWCCLESLLGAHTWRVKFNQLELKVAPVRLQGDADLSPSLSWVPCSFCRAKMKNVEAKLFQRAGQTDGRKCSDCSRGEVRLEVPRLPFQAGMKRCAVPREGKSFMLELGVWQEVLLSTAVCLF